MTEGGPVAHQPSRRGAEIQELVMGTLARLGVPVSERGDGVWETLLEPPVWTGEPSGHVVLAFDEEAAREDGVDLITFGHPLLGAIVERALGLARASEAFVRVHHIDADALVSKLSAQIAFERLRPESPRAIEPHLGLVWRFDHRLCLTSDIVEELPLTTYLEAGLGLELPEWEGRDLDLGSAPQTLLPVAAQKPLAVLARVAGERARRDASGLEAAMRAQLDTQKAAEERRIRAFFAARREDLASRHTRRNADADARLARTIELEEGVRLKDLEVKYALSSELRLDRIVAYRVPLVGYRLCVRFGHTAHELEGRYDPVSGRHLGFLCPSCGAGMRALVGDRDRGVMCAACWPAAHLTAVAAEAPSEESAQRGTARETNAPAGGDARESAPAAGPTARPVARSAESGRRAEAIPPTEPRRLPAASMDWIHRTGRLASCVDTLLILARTTNGREARALERRQVSESTARSLLDDVQTRIGHGLAWPVASRQTVLGVSPILLPMVMDGSGGEAGAAFGWVKERIRSMPTPGSVGASWSLYDGILPQPRQITLSPFAPIASDVSGAFWLVLLTRAFYGSEPEINIKVPMLRADEEAAARMDDLLSRDFGLTRSGTGFRTLAAVDDYRLVPELVESLRAAIARALRSESFDFPRAELVVDEEKQSGLQPCGIGRLRFDLHSGRRRPPPVKKRRPGL